MNDEQFLGKSGQPLMRDLFFLFCAPLFALLLYFLLRPPRHCYYTLVEEERQKEFLWKGAVEAQEKNSSALPKVVSVSLL